MDEEVRSSREQQAAGQRSWIMNSRLWDDETLLAGRGFKKLAGWKRRIFYVGVDFM